MNISISTSYLNPGAVIVRNHGKRKLVVRIDAPDSPDHGKIVGSITPGDPPTVIYPLKALRIGPHEPRTRKVRG